MTLGVGFVVKTSNDLFSCLGSTGILEFALIYDEINQLLLVNILRAKVKGIQIMNFDKSIDNLFFQHLRGLDVNGLCDSYCKITLQPAIKNVHIHSLFRALHN